MIKSLWTFILYIVFPLVVLGFLFWLGWGGVLNQSHNLTVKETYAGDIGLVSLKSQPLEKDFTIVNRGKENITIGRVYTDCKCLSVSVSVGSEIFGPFDIPSEENSKPLEINVPSGAEMPIKLIFSPADAKGPNFSGNIFIETIKAEEILKIPIKGNIIVQ